MSAPQADSTRTAEQESEAAMQSVIAALEDGVNFKLEAGAGAGKTYSLIRAVQHILADRPKFLSRPDQQIACLTYTNVARDEIVNRTDASPFVFADTLHGFLWEMIRPYQKALAQSLLVSTKWKEVLEGQEDLVGRLIDYDLGIRSVGDEVVTLHHDDIPSLAISLFNKPKFRSLIADRFPIIFIDEYQDTPQGLVEAMLIGQEEDRRSSTFGFFGDHWQQIYDKACGSISHPTVIAIPKNANFRSDTSIVSFLNQLRPELPQAPAEGAGKGKVTVYHTNEWPGERLGGTWKGQISHGASHKALEWVVGDVKERLGDNATDDAKTLMLTHSSIANELGYGTLPAVFKYNDSFIRKEDPVLAYLLDVVEPATEAFRSRKYGELFEVLGRSRPHIRSPREKRQWTFLFDALEEARTDGTVGDVLDLLAGQDLFSLPGKVERRRDDLEEALLNLESGTELSEPRHLAEYRKLREVFYSEVEALAAYVKDKTVFSTKHNVKGSQFDSVVVVLGRGWTAYDFAKMINNYPNRDSLAGRDQKSFARSRNLFYVAVSRAKHNLVLLFTQKLEEQALSILAEWVGESNIVSVNFSDEGTPVSR